MKFTKLHSLLTERVTDDLLMLKARISEELDTEDMIWQIGGEVLGDELRGYGIEAEGEEEILALKGTDDWNTVEQAVADFYETNDHFRDEQLQTHFDFTRLIRNGWLVSWTNDAHSVARDGFTSGVQIGNEYQLGLSTHYTDESKSGGYTFSYSAERPKYYKYGDKYGSEVVLYQGSGVEAYHYGDEEQQVISIGKYARNLIPIFKGEGGDFYVGDDEEHPYAIGELEEVVNWCIKNFDQYKRKLVTNPRSIR